MYITSQEWTQIKAALTLWLEIAMRSKVHPTSHPEVEKLYAESKHIPMSADAIIEFLERPYPRIPPAGVSVTDAAKSLNVKPTNLASWLKRNHKTPVHKIGPYNLWSWADATEGAAAIRKRTSQFRERYEKWHAKV